VIHGLTSSFSLETSRTTIVSVGSWSGIRTMKDSSDPNLVATVLLIQNITSCHKTEE
jgi:hypothetical protein